MRRLALAAAALLAGCPSPAGPPPSRDAVLKTIPVGLTPHGVGAAGGFVYVGSIDGGMITVIDAARDEKVAAIARPGGRVVYLLPFPDGKHMAALDNATGEVLVIDPAAQHAVIQAVKVGAGPDEASFAADGSLVVALADEDKVVRLAFGTDRMKAPERRDYAVGTAAGATNRHRPLGHATGWALVPNTADNDATLTDLATGAARRLADGNNPGPVAIAPIDGAPKVAIVGWRASHRVTFHDLAGGEAVKVEGNGLFPQAIALEPSLKRAFVVMSSSDEVAVYDYEKKAAIGKVAVGARPVEAQVWPGAADAAARYLWVGNDGGDSATVLDATSLQVKATVAAGAGHHHLATWGGKAYVSNMADGTVTVIDRRKVE